jgi:flagellum-specific peptidoglycan hydrolase FlgJ
MFYKFDKNELLWKKNWKRLFHSIIVVIILVLSSFISGRYVKFQSLETFEKELIVLNVQAEKNKFTKEKFVKELKRLNIKQPHIVMAQSIIETGHWNSKIFKENHNLFGMREASVRINTAVGTQNNHAYYNTWMESIYDYAFYQCRYLGGLRTEAEYYAYLGANYAEDPDYVNVVKGVVKRERLKELF